MRLLLALFALTLLAEDKPKPKPEPKHLTAEQQRDLVEAIADTTNAQLALDRQTAALNKKAEELRAVCGGPIARDAKGHWDCETGK